MNEWMNAGWDYYYAIMLLYGWLAQQAEYRVSLICKMWSVVCGCGIGGGGDEDDVDDVDDIWWWGGWWISQSAHHIDLLLSYQSQLISYL